MVRARWNKEVVFAHCTGIGKQMKLNKRVLTMVTTVVLMFGGLFGASAAYATGPSELASLSVGSIPWDAVLSPDGTRAYVSSTNPQGNVTVIDIPTRTVVTSILVGSRAYGLDITPDGTKIYVANRDSNNVSVISVATNSVIATVAVGSTPIGVAVSKDGTKAYVANSASNSVSVIDTATDAVQTTIGSLPTGPSSIETNMVNGEVYVASWTANQVTKIVGTSISGSSLAVSNSSRLAVTPNGTQLFVQQASSNSVAVVDIASWSVSTTFNIGILSFSTAFSPAGDVFFAPHSFYGNQVSLFNATTGAAITGTGYPLTLTGHDGGTVLVTPNCLEAVVVMQNYPDASAGPVGFANIISTGLPDCTPAPAPPAPSPALANTGALPYELQVGSFVTALIALGLGVAAVQRGRKIRQAR